MHELIKNWQMVSSQDIKWGSRLMHFMMEQRGLQGSEIFFSISGIGGKENGFSLPGATIRLCGVGGKKSTPGRTSHCDRGLRKERRRRQVEFLQCMRSTVGLLAPLQHQVLGHVLSPY